MGRRTQTILAMALTLLAGASCTVMEDREPCPCILGIDLGRIADAHSDLPRGAVSIFQWIPELTGPETVDPSEGLYYEWGVPKGDVTVGVYAGAGTMKQDKGRVTVPKGSQCDSLYASSDVVACLGETSHLEPVLRKQFATIRLTMATDPGETYTYSLRVRGGWVGTDMKDLSPVAGEFEFTPAPGGKQGNVFTVRVPRQGDDSLEVDVLRPDGTSQTFAIGEMIAGDGYSWTAADLGDIDIDLEHDKITTGVTLVPWGDGNSPVNK